MKNNKTRIKSNSIELMVNLNTILTTISDNPKYGDHHEATDEELTRKKYVVALVNHDLSTMINRKESD